MAGALEGRNVAILATGGVEQIELEEPRRVLRDAGAKVEVVSLEPGKIQAMHQDIDKGDMIEVDWPIDRAVAGQFDALVLPGGTVNPDRLRQNDAAVAFVRGFVADGKPVAAICHGPWTLIEAGVVRGRTMTSYPSLRTDLRNAGAEVVDEEVVVDDNLITSRDPGDLEAFCGKLVEALS
ncbi:type 1 glutamine amidotransferase domain-containing protein [Spirillospora sp. NPDC050679]